MPSVYRKAEIDRAIEQVQRLVDGGTLRVHVDAGAASGRSVVGRELADDDLLDVLGPRHPDMVADALLQVMTLTGAQAPPAGSLRDRLTWMQKLLSKRNKPVFLRLHNEWATAYREPDASGFHDRAAAWLVALLGPQTRSQVVLIGAIGQRIDGEQVPLRIPWVDWTEVEDRIQWHDSNYEAAAFSVRKRCAGYGRVSPIVYRLAVGRMALGDDLDRIQLDLNRGGLQPRPHVDALLSRVQASPRFAELIDPLSRVSRLRRPLPLQAVMEALGLPDGDPDLDLFTACLGYTQADDTVRWSETVLDALRDALHQGIERQPHAINQHHHALASACKTVDGVDEPERAQGLAGLRYWSEKVHHLACSGELGADEWSKQSGLQNEQLWERARALSWSGAYAEATELYRRCVRQDPDDAYAWHYLGFNLDKEGTDRGATEHAFEQAVSLQSGNPWWNARWITWLIGQVRYADAERAWEDALGHIDPSGTRNDPWLVHHFYRHVIAAWLGCGEVGRARAALEALPKKLRASGEALALEAVIVDFEEGFELQGSVRPFGLVGQERWQRRSLPDHTENGTALRRWYAGQVVRSGDEGVVVRFATAENEGRRVVINTLDWETWAQGGGSRIPSELGGRFVEIGEYGAGEESLLLIRLLDRVQRPAGDGVGRSWMGPWNGQ